MPFLRTATSFGIALKPIMLVTILISCLVILSHGSVIEADSLPRHCGATTENLLRIGVPSRPFSKDFVKITTTSSPAKKKYDGFCIKLFEKVVKILTEEKNISLRYEFEEFNGTYNDLVAQVANKSFSAAVGDITILAERWNGVEFTVPFTESGLAVVVPVKPAPKARIFLEPFTLKLWLVTGALLIYTMFIVWFLEHPSNSEFCGLGNALWFTFSSLFLVHRERIGSNYTRVVVVVWLFVSLILTQSYTASLTSMLTISRIQQPDLESLKVSNASVGSDGNAFLRNFVVEVLQFKNVVNITFQEDYRSAFQNGSISAAFLEVPYAKHFVHKYRKKYTLAGSTYRFGGLGFVFQKGCPLAAAVSEAILKLSEDGTLKGLEDQWLTPSSECSDSQTTENPDSLCFESFWGLYLFSVVTSFICLLLHVLHCLLQNHRPFKQSRPQVHDIAASEETESTRSDPTSGQAAPETELP